ncbi:MAG TPA: glycosyltransferase family 39 protein, partial [Bacteroidales bacterium]|nr:glycosyltransferase family 39 protein [Bacteroidales bacterium]
MIYSFKFVKEHSLKDNQLTSTSRGLYIMNESGSNRKYFLFFLFAWFLLNLLQAHFTEITNDEAYYARFARELAWGYFDHPPMVAFLVRLSSRFFGSNLGVRFMTVLLQPVTLFIIWKTLDVSKLDINTVKCFFLVAASTLVFMVFGFIATPDAPLLFFTALFLFSYRRFLSNAGWKEILLLAFAVAGLIYSKYQSVILLALVVLSNRKLFTSYKFLLAIAISFILLLPHILWQLLNGLPGIRYHLIDRAGGFDLSNVLLYLPVQLAIFNPFISVAGIYIIIRKRAEDHFTKALYYIVGGMPLFFLIMSFRGHTEPHWTALVSVPLIIIIVRSGYELGRFLYYTLLPSLIIICAARILVVTDILPVRKLDLAGKQEKFEYISYVAGDYPVIFLGSYPYPAAYSYFTGKESMPVNSFFSRRTQYDIWQPEVKYNNKRVFVCGFGEGPSVYYKKGDIGFYGYFTDSLQTVNRIQVNFENSSFLHSGDTIRSRVTFYNPYPYSIDFNHRNFPVTVSMGYIRGSFHDFFPVEMDAPVEVIKPGETLMRDFTYIIPEIKPGKYSYGICLVTLT